MQEKSGMECTIQWMRKKYTIIQKVLSEHASRAGACVPAYLQNMYLLVLVAVDMAQKNSVIAEYIGSIPA
jgi:hypothetical protein